jgi:predicted dehydrogenase
VGTEGALAFPQLELWRHPQLAAPDWRQTLECTTRDVHRQNPMHLQLEHFLSIIKGEAQPLITASDATRSLATVLGILQSAEQQGPISLDSVLAGS